MIALIGQTVQAH